LRLTAKIIRLRVLTLDRTPSVRVRIEISTCAGTDSQSKVKMLSLSKSRLIAERAIDRAHQLDVRICVAVCDNAGRLIVMNRMDDANIWEIERCAIGKAIAAAIIGRPSNQLFEYLSEGIGRHALTGNVVAPRGQQGGLPVIQEGLVEGSCGVSGSPNLEQDEECALAGIAALALKKIDALV
jgi:glc operon protein GlcG